MTNSILDAAVAHFEGKGAEKMEVPEWGHTIHVRRLSLNERCRLESETDHSRQIAQTVIMAVVDEKGEPLFKNDTSTLAKLEGKVDPRLLMKIAAKARGFGVEEAKNG